MIVYDYSVSDRDGVFLTFHAHLYYRIMCGNPSVTPQLLAGRAALMARAPLYAHGHSCPFYNCSSLSNRAVNTIPIIKVSVRYLRLTRTTVFRVQFVAILETLHRGIPLCINVIYK